MYICIYRYIYTYIYTHIFYWSILTYNVILLSAIEHSEPVIHTLISTLFYTLFPVLYSRSLLVKVSIFKEHKICSKPHPGERGKRQFTKVKLKLPINI